LSLFGVTEISEEVERDMKTHLTNFPLNWRLKLFANF